MTKLLNGKETALSFEEIVLGCLRCFHSSDVSRPKVESALYKLMNQKQVDHSLRELVAQRFINKEYKKENNDFVYSINKQTTETMKIIYPIWMDIIAPMLLSRQWN